MYSVIVFLLLFGPLGNHRRKNKKNAQKQKIACEKTCENTYHETLHKLFEQSTSKKFKIDKKDALRANQLCIMGCVQKKNQKGGI